MVDSSAASRRFRGGAGVLAGFFILVGVLADSGVAPASRRFPLRNDANEK